MVFTESSTSFGIGLLRDVATAKIAGLSFLIDQAATHVYNPKLEVQIRGVGLIYAEVREQRIALLEIRRRFYQYLEEGHFDFTSGFPRIFESPRDDKNGCDEKKEEIHIMLRGLFRVAANQLERPPKMETNLDLLCLIASSKVHFADQRENWVKTGYGAMCYQQETQRRALVDLGALYQERIASKRIMLSPTTGMPTANNKTSEEALILSALHLSYEKNKQLYLRGHPQLREARVGSGSSSSIEKLR